MEIVTLGWVSEVNICPLMAIQYEQMSGGLDTHFRRFPSRIIYFLVNFLNVCQNKCFWKFLAKLTDLETSKKLLENLQLRTRATDSIYPLFPVVVICRFHNCLFSSNVHGITGLPKHVELRILILGTVTMYTVYI